MSRAPRARTVRNLGDPVAAALLLNSDSGTSCAEQSSGASQSSEGSAISPALLRATTNANLGSPNPPASSPLGQGAQSSERLDGYSPDGSPRNPARRRIEWGVFVSSS